jgi:hypothetical protein
VDLLLTGQKKYIVERGEQAREIEAALASANRHSEALEHLLTEIRDSGDPGSDVVEKIGETNKRWTEQMRRYLDACMNAKAPKE